MTFIPPMGVFGACLSTFILSVAALITRFVCKWRVGYRSEDWVALGATFSLLLGVILVSLAVFLGGMLFDPQVGILGFSDDIITIQRLSREDSIAFVWGIIDVSEFSDFGIVGLGIYEWLSECNIIIVTTLIKIAALLWYRRHLGGSRFAMGLLIFCAASSAGFLGGSLAGNNDRHFGLVGAMIREVPGQVAMYIMASALDLLTNLIVIGMFIKGTWTSAIPSRQKAVCSFLIFIAILAAVCGALRCVVHGMIMGDMSSAEDALGGFGLDSEEQIQNTEYAQTVLRRPDFGAALLSFLNSRGSTSFVDPIAGQSITRALMFWGSLEMGLGLTVVNLLSCGRLLGNGYSSVRQYNHGGKA